MMVKLFSFMSCVLLRSMTTKLGRCYQYQVSGRVHHNHPTLTSRCLSKLFHGKGTPTRCVLAVLVMTLPHQRSGKNKALSNLVGAKVNW